MSDLQPGGLGDKEVVDVVEDVATDAAAYLSAAEILNADDLNEEDVECPEWGGKVRVRALSKQRQQALRKASAPGGEFDAGLFEMALFVEGVITPVFDASQMDALRQKSAKPVDRVTKKVMQLSGMAEDAVDDAEATFPDGPEA